MLCLSVYLPGLWTIPPVDRDESRFAQASRQMHESGDWIVPRVQDKPRLNKPPLIYWLQNASIAAFGDEPGRYDHGNIWVFRVPSVLCAVIAVFLTWRIGLRLVDARAAWLGAAMLAVSPIVVWDAHQARADELLLACTTGAMLALTAVWQRSNASGHRPSLAWPLTFWFCIAAGILAKGPITPMIAGLAIVTLSLLAGRWRWVGSLRPVLGVLVVAALVLPWVIAVGQRVGWGAYAQTIFDETLGRSAAPKEGHWGPPGYHLVLLTVLMWPGSLLTGWALLHDRARDAAGPRGVAARIRRWFSDDPARRFLLAWAAPSWLVFELVSTKLPHYTMPLYPALALLSAQALVRVHDGDRRITDLGTRAGLGIWWVVGIAATLGLSGVVLWAGRLEDGVSLDDSVRNYVAPAVLIVLFLVAAGRSLVRGALLRAQLQAMVAIVAWGATFLHYVLPGAQRFWVSSRVVAAMETTGATRLVNNSSFTEDSLLFLTRGRITRDDGDSPGDAARLLSAEPTADGQTTPPPAAATRIRGFNYSTGRTVDLWLTRPAAAPEAPSP